MRDKRSSFPEWPSLWTARHQVLARSSWENPDDAAASVHCHGGSQWWWAFLRQRNTPLKWNLWMSSCSLEPPRKMAFSLVQHLQQDEEEVNPVSNQPAFRFSTSPNKCRSCRRGVGSTHGFLKRRNPSSSPVGEAGTHHLLATVVRKECWKFCWKLAKYICISVGIYNEVISHQHIPKWVANSTCWKFYEMCR